MFESFCNNRHNFHNRRHNACIIWWLKNESDLKEFLDSSVCNGGFSDIDKEIWLFKILKF